MGFDAHHAANALECADGDVSRAVAFLQENRLGGFACSVEGNSGGFAFSVSGPPIGAANAVPGCAVSNLLGAAPAGASLSRSVRSNAGFDAVSERCGANCDDELDAEHLEDEAALYDTLQESEFWELLKSVHPHVLQAAREAGAADPHAAANMIQEAVPHVDFFGLVATFENAFYTFLFDEHESALHGMNIHGEGDDVALPPETLGTPSGGATSSPSFAAGGRSSTAGCGSYGHHAVPVAVVQALQLTDADVEAILQLCDWVGSTFTSIAPIYVRSGRNKELALQAIHA